MKGASLLHHEQEELRKKLEQQKKRLQRRNSQKQITVKEEDIADVVSQWTRIPVQKLAESESARLKSWNRLFTKEL